jgi:hypothetical protein
MWRDLPDEDKQEYIDEYEIEKVRTSNYNKAIHPANVFIES